MEIITNLFKKKVTLSQLEKLHACGTQKEIFIRVFGKKAILTKENVMIARQEGLDLMWLIRMLWIMSEKKIEKKSDFLDRWNECKTELDEILAMHQILNELL